MTYIEIAAKILHRDQDPILYRELVHACALMAPSFFKECPKDHAQHFEYMFRTIHRHVHQMPKHQISQLLQILNEQN